MTIRTYYLAAAAAIGALAVPAAAQTGYPYPQPYQQYPQAYPQSGYGYPGQPGYGVDPVTQVINQLLGNRYNVNDRTAVQRCASAAMVQASNQYGRSGYNGYNNGYGQGYGQQYGYNGASAMRVTAITDVQRRNRGLRVSGMLANGYNNYGVGAYGNQGYNDPRYASARGNLSFRCNVDYSGAVTNVRIRRA